MVETQIRSRGLRDDRVLEAMAAIPRDRFVPPHLADRAYEDRALPVACEQTISQPFIVAFMTEHVTLAPRHRVLEIGTGTGYQTAVAASLCRHVHTIERFDELQRAARARLDDLGLDNISYHVGDGSTGLPDEAPFDAILVTAAAPKVPTALVNQLVDGGRLVAPVGGAYEQTIVRVVRTGLTHTEAPLLACRFVKLVGEQGWASEE